MHEGMMDYNEAQLTELVSEIDHDLTLLADLHPGGRTCRSLLVSRTNDKNEDEKLILKVRPITSNVWDETYFYNEIHALRRCQERKLKNVTHMAGEYQTHEYHGILKAFAKGTPCNQTDSDALLRDPNFIKRLDKLYLELHLAGIAKIKFQPRKIVITDEDELILVDLSTCVVNTEVGMLQFSQEMRVDSRFITGLEKLAARNLKGAT